MKCGSLMSTINIIDDLLEMGGREQGGRGRHHFLEMSDLSNQVSYIHKDRHCKKWGELNGKVMDRLTESELSTGLGSVNPVGIGHPEPDLKRRFRLFWSLPKSQETLWESEKGELNSWE